MKVNKVLMLVFVFVGLMSIVSFASNENNAFMKKDIDVYNINNKCFDDLIYGNTNITEFVNEQNKINYSLIDGNDEYMLKSVIEQGKKIEEPVKYGLYSRIGKVPINKELIEYVSGKEIKNLIEKNGVKGTVNKTLIFYSDFSESMDIPPIILVNSGGMNYFITIDYKLNNESTDYKYVYKFYNQKEFLKKYGIRYGSLKVNDKTFEKSILLRNNGALIPLRNTIESLGGNVLWNENSRELQIFYNNNEFTMAIGKKLSFKKNEAVENLFLNRPGTICDFYSDIVDDRLYVNERVMEVILSNINYKLYVDLDKSTVYIR